VKVNLSKFVQSSISVKVFRLLHPFVGYWYMWVLGKLYYVVNRSERRVIQRSIREVLASHSEKYVNKVIRKTFEGIFAHYYEKLFSAFRGYQEIRRFVRARFQVRGLELIDAALAQNRGVILVTAHWGAVEFIPWVLTLRGYPLSVVLECQSRILRQALEEKTRYCDAQLIDTSDGTPVLIRAKQSLAQNRILMTECDEVDHWRRRSGQTIELFGKRLYFDSTLDVLAGRTGAPVVGAFLKRTGRHSYTLYCENVSIQRRVKSTAWNVMQLWQHYVSRNPEQWYQWKKWQAMKAAS
jgi:Kdo2-lipid IVA lauroyltransferase/acyltransferase